MRFTKMHGAGNDFIVVDRIADDIPDDHSALARKLCDRRLGIGADGFMVLDRADGDADYKLLFYNADGSLGEMCGNGARCIARFAYERGHAGVKQTIQTTAGLVFAERIDETTYRVRLNDPSVMEERRAEGLDCSYLELGDPGIPHAVVLLDDWDTIPEDALRELGRRLRYSPVFPKGANVSFVKQTDGSTVKAITYERGVEDFTLACGTGCGSIAATLIGKGLVSGESVRIFMPGGELSVTLKYDGGRVRDILLTGPTCVTFTGEC